MNHLGAIGLAGMLAVAVLRGQTSGVVLRGAVQDPVGQALAGVEMTAREQGTGLTRRAVTDERGEYSFALLPRGIYALRAALRGYQAVEQQGLELAVTEKKSVLFTLTPLSAVQEGSGVNHLLSTLPPPPVIEAETVASSVSLVIDESKLLFLPLASRNIYSLFLLQPGVTSQGAVVRRGLSFAVHGQRVSGSNYSLDGVDNNNIVLSGPLAITSAETIQEFRMVNSSFSADNGRATAFVAHVATRAGSNQLHGSAFEFLANDRLNANSFANNAARQDRPPLRQNQFGYFAGGPVLRNRVFFASGLESSRLHYSTPVSLRLPSAVYIASLPPESLARRLLAENPPLPTTPSTQDPNIGEASYPIPGRINTLLLTERVDYYTNGGQDRFVGRYTLSATNEDPGRNGGALGFPTLQPTDRYWNHNSLLGWIHSFSGGPVNDFRVGWSRERLHLPRPRGDLPLIQVGGVLPVTNARQADQRENNNVVQFSDVFSLRRGRSAVTGGFDYRRNLSSGLTLGIESDALGGPGLFPSGLYLFPNLRAFAQGQLRGLSLSVDRLSSGPFQLPDLHRKTRSGDYAAFLQDDLRLSRRFSLNLGLRYEYFGIPHSLQPFPDLNFYFGSGSTIEERLATGDLRETRENPGDLAGLLYRRDRLNLAPSLGLAWDPWGRGRTVVRAGYSVALDRVLDTVRDTRSNTQQQVDCQAPVCTARFLLPIDLQLPLLSRLLGPARVLQLDENLRTPYAQNWYAGLQQTLTPSLLIEIGHAGSVGRKLISRDATNRIINGRVLNPRILSDTFLSNAGNSNYLALEAALRRRFSRGLQFGISYTYSHAIDNQSDILEGARTGLEPEGGTLATFTRQFDARADRGSANFDQRQNLVFHAIWDIPTPRFSARWLDRVCGRWTASTIGAYRSGFPVTLVGSVNTPGPGLVSNRVDFVGTPGAGVHPETPHPVPGGVQWVEPGLFQLARDHLGTLGRGAVKGPGFWNYDFALMRNLAPRAAKMRAQLRAEFYNLFNHANLSTPITLYTDPNFGRAYYGRNRTYSRYGDLPLDNPARRIQLALRMQF